MRRVDLPDAEIMLMLGLLNSDTVGIPARVSRTGIVKTMADRLEAALQQPPLPSEPKYNESAMEGAELIHFPNQTDAGTDKT